MARKPEYAGAWRRIRKQILERDNHTCQIQNTGCTTHATEVDHIIPTSQGGAWWDTNNLRASCRKCNNTRIDRTGNNKWQHNTNTHITLITGAPASGKTHHIQQHAREGDLIIDYAALLDAIGGNSKTRTENHPLHPAVTAARTALIRSIRRAEINVPRIWLTSTNPNAPDFMPHHRHIELDPGEEECLRRSKERGDPPYMERIIRAWYTPRTASKQEGSRQW